MGGTVNDHVIPFPCEFYEGEGQFPNGSRLTGNGSCSIFRFSPSNSPQPPIRGTMFRFTAGRFRKNQAVTLSIAHGFHVPR
jgi:hypothetical protein